MLLLPLKAQRKNIARLLRRCWRRRLMRLLIFLFLLYGLGNSASLPQHALPVDLELAAAPYQFDFVDWEFRAVASELARRWNPPPLPPAESDQAALAVMFVNQMERLAELERNLDQLSHTPPVRTAARGRRLRLSQELANTRTTQNQLTPQVELILARQVETILREEGFTIAGQVFPPVTFRFIEPPTALIISPRDRIENQHFVGLQPGLDRKLREKIEQALDQRGDISTYVTDIGGLGSYPSMVINHPSLPYLVETVAHEWVHNYLFTFPTNIAWAYQSQPKLMTINETTASLVGAELNRKVILRFYPDLVGQLPALDQAGQPLLTKPSEFSLSMRRIRQQVDRLLAQGEIEEAEAFMEAERVKLAQQGYHLRKLNQAYFAFHGSYALSPGSVDPIGPQIRQLRAASPSLKAFLDQVGWLNSYNDYLAWLAISGIE